MRLGVLDIGSNTVHLLVADARPGGRPLATTSKRTVLRLMRYLAPDGSITDEGVTALVDRLNRDIDNADESARSQVEGFRSRAPSHGGSAEPGDARPLPPSRARSAAIRFSASFSRLETQGVTYLEIRLRLMQRR